jgi:hypothetical protein
MKRNIGVASAAVLLVLGASIGRAAQLDQDFAIKECVGQCDIAAPSSSSFLPVVKGKRYAYGSSIRAGRESSMTVQLPEGNEFRLLAGGDGASITTDGGRELMTMKVSSGSFNISFTDTAGNIHQVSAPMGTTVRLRSEQTTSADGKHAVRVTLTVVKPDGSPLPPATFVVPYSGTFPLRHGAAIRTITEQFTTGTTPTPIGQGR